MIVTYRHDTSREGSDSIIFTRPGKCWYGIPSHTVPVRALSERPYICIEYGPTLVNPELHGNNTCTSLVA